LIQFFNRYPLENVKLISSLLHLLANLAHIRPRFARLVGQKLSPKLVSLLASEHGPTQRGSARICCAIACEDVPAVQGLLDAGLLNTFKQLSDSKSTDDKLKELMLLCLSNVVASTVDHIQQVVDSGLFKWSVDCLSRGSRCPPIVKREAAWVVTNALSDIHLGKTIGGQIDCIQTLADYLKDTEPIESLFKAAKSAIELAKPPLPNT
jgi:hypothetical protein